MRPAWAINHAVMGTAVEFTLSGCANNHPITITGSGEIADRDGVGDDEARCLRITLRMDQPMLNWDPAFALLGGLDALLVAAAGVFGRNGEELDESIVAHTRAHVFDEGNREVGGIATQSQTTIEPGMITCHAQLLHANVLVEVGEKMAGLWFGGVAVLRHSRGLSVLTEVVMDTTRGAELQASVVTRVFDLDGVGVTDEVLGAGVCFELVELRRTIDESAETVECEVLLGVHPPP